MNLLDFIDLSLKQESSRLSPSAIDKVKDCAEAIKAFVHGRDCDIRDAILSDFLIQFAYFLTDEAGRGYSRTTAIECLRTLRKYLRMAITRGLIPNIDLVPAVIAQLEAESPTGGKKARGQTVKPLILGTADCIESLTRTLDAWHTKQTMEAPKKPTRQERDEALQTRCVAIYLFCLLNYGIGIGEALSIKGKPGAGEEMYVDKDGAKLPVSLASCKLAQIYNGGAPQGEHLFSTLDNQKYRGDLSKATALIEGHLSRFFKRKALPLYIHKSVYTDYLNFVIERGLEASEAEKLWSLHRGRCTSAYAMGAILAAGNICHSGKGGIDERWYLLSVISPAVGRDRFLKMFQTSGILGSVSESKKRIYAPQERLRDKDRGQVAVLARYIFFRATPAQAQFANVFSPYAYVLRGRSRSRFAQIKEREIEELQIILRDFPAEVELIDGKEWLEKHNAEIEQGCKAIIRSGSLAGKEATVVRVKGKSSESPTYFLEYVEGAIKFRTDLTGLELEIVKS